MAHAGRDRSSRGVRAALVSGPEDDHGFEKLALPHLAYLYRLAVRLQGNARDAEDVVQETYERALKAFPSLRQPDRIRPWLCQILSRIVLDRHRAAPREVAV